MPKTQYYGITFPIQTKTGKSLLDLSTTKADMVRSQLTHLVFTPEGQKLRDPMFGTNLIKYIFDINDNITWDDMVMQVKDKVSKYVPGCNVTDISTEQTDDERGVRVNIRYTVTEDDGTTGEYQLEQII